jgi:alcohol dehydrogenase, propanol-preferring
VQALRLDQPAPASSHPLHEVTLPDLTPDDGEVVIAVRACGVCRTDLQLSEGDLAARRLPIIPGHQVVGVVTATGSGVDRELLGARVGVAWIASTCGVCRFCTSGRENLCDDSRFTGWDRDGGFATQITARADFVYPLPEGFSDLAAAPLLCGGVIGYRSLGVASVGPASAGLALGLFGFGASATCVLQVATFWGCDAYVLTRSEPEQQRALDLGATWAGPYSATPPRPLDAAITFAPSGDVVVRALELVDKGGVVAVNAIHLDRVPSFPYELLWWERQLRSVANVTRADVAGFLQLAADVPIETQIEVFDLGQANVALQRLAEGGIAGSAVLEV